MHPRADFETTAVASGRASISVSPGLAWDRRRAMRLGALIFAAGLAVRMVRPAFADPRPRMPGMPLTIVLDPGHGGIDPGCTGPAGTKEKQIVLEIARETARRLGDTGRFLPLLTRTDDQRISLGDRMAFAHAARADLFLSIHADAVPDPSVHGATVYTLSEEASDRAAETLAARENAADLLDGIDLDRHPAVVGNILLDLARRETNAQSMELARKLVATLGDAVPLLDHSHRSASFAVLKAPDIPSVLIEVGCLSNRDEELRLCSADYRSKLATGMVASIDAYFSEIVPA